MSLLRHRSTGVTLLADPRARAQAQGRQGRSAAWRRGGVARAQPLTERPTPNDDAKGPGPERSRLPLPAVGDCCGREPVAPPQRAARRARGPATPARALVLALLVAATLWSCTGYSDLPLPLRELAALEVESADLHPRATGRVQVVARLPEDVEGPVVVVGHPAMAPESPGVRVVAWAAGPCSAAPPTTSGPLRLCLAVEVFDRALPEILIVTAVVESRGDGRRFTAVGEITAP